MKRRLNLACGLVHEPALVLLDEPTVGVDPQSRNLIFEEVRRLNQEGGRDPVGSARARALQYLDLDDREGAGSVRVPREPPLQEGDAGRAGLEDGALALG